VISSGRARPGDLILLSAPIGDHGMAVMSCRENLEFEGEIKATPLPFTSWFRRC